MPRNPNRRYRHNKPRLTSAKPVPLSEKFLEDVDKNVKETGWFPPACKIKFNKKGELEIENYGQKPLRFANVYREK
jgi:hypothetical protein